jgi:large subunit ribosomal protein L25
MDTFTLAADVGRATGSRAARRLRREGMLPGVVYGHGADPVPVAVDRRSLRQVLTQAGTNALINLQVDGKTQLTIVKDLQRDPVGNRVTHVDFQVVSAQERMTVEVPIVLEGEAEAVSREGGVVQLQLLTLTVTASVTAIPQSLPFDVSELVLDDQVRVSDLALPAGVETDLDPDTIVVVAHRPRIVLEEEPAEGEEVEGEEAAEDAGEQAGDGAGDSEASDSTSG